MSPINQPHNKLEALLNELLVKTIPASLIVRPQCSFALSDISEPEPDLAIRRSNELSRLGGYVACVSHH